MAQQCTKDAAHVDNSLEVLYNITKSEKNVADRLETDSGYIYLISEEFNEKNY